jgi:hypothetical protein
LIRKNNIFAISVPLNDEPAIGQQVDRNRRPASTKGSQIVRANPGATA